MNRYDYHRDYGDYDGEYDPEIDCEHEDYDIDVCTGRASCNCCSNHWYVSSEEIDRELHRQASYYEDMEREDHWQWWWDLWHHIRSALAWRPWGRTKPSARDTNDDIPF